MSFMLLGNNWQVFASTPNILSCNEVRYFWIRWANGYIEVGKGMTVGVDHFMAYQRGYPPEVNYFGLAGQEDTNRYWVFTELPRMFIIILFVIFLTIKVKIACCTICTIGMFSGQVSQSVTYVHNCI